MVVGEDDILAALDVHGVADGTELAACDAHIASAGDVEGALAGTAAHWCIGGEIDGGEIVHQSSSRSAAAFEVQGRALELLGDLDVILIRSHHEVLLPPHDVLRQRGAHKGDDLRRLSAAAHGHRIVVVVKAHMVIAIAHLHVLAQLVGAEVLACTLDFPSLILLRPRHDLPEVTVVPHELPAAQQRATLHRHALGMGEDFTFASLLPEPMHADDGTGDAIRLHIAKQNVVSGTFLRGGDLDAFCIRIRLPGIFLLGRIKDVSEKLTTLPGEVGNVLTSKQHDACFVGQCGRQMKPRTVSEDGGVGDNRQRLGAIELVVAGRNRDYSALLHRWREELSDSGRIVRHA